MDNQEIEQDEDAYWGERAKKIVADGGFLGTDATAEFIQDKLE